MLYCLETSLTSKGLRRQILLDIHLIVCLETSLTSKGLRRMHWHYRM